MSVQQFYVCRTIDAAPATAMPTQVIRVSERHGTFGSGLIDLLRLDVGSLHHLAPFLCFCGDQGSILDAD